MTLNLFGDDGVCTEFAGVNTVEGWTQTMCCLNACRIGMFPLYFHSICLRQSMVSIEEMDICCEFTISLSSLITLFCVVMSVWCGLNVLDLLLFGSGFGDFLIVYGCVHVDQSIIQESVKV